MLKLVGLVPQIATSKTLLYGPAFADQEEEMRSPKLVRLRQPPPKDHHLLIRVAANVLHELWRNQVCEDYGTDEDPEPAQVSESQAGASSEWTQHRRRLSLGSWARPPAQDPGNASSPCY